MFLKKRTPEPLAPSQTAFLTEFMALDTARREDIMAKLKSAREGQLSEEISEYLYAHEDEFYVFSLPSVQISEEIMTKVKPPEESDCRIYIRRDMTYGRMVAVDDFYETVLLETDDQAIVIGLYNFVFEADKKLYKKGG